MIKSLKRLINNLDVQLIKFALILVKLQNLTKLVSEVGFAYQSPPPEYLAMATS